MCKNEYYYTFVVTMVKYNVEIIQIYQNSKNFAIYMKLLCPIYFKLISYYVFDYVQELIEDYWETEKQITMLIVFKLLRKWNISLLPGKKPLRQWVNSNYFGLIWRIKCLVFVKMQKNLDY